MKALSRMAAGLYARLLGPHWCELAGVVQRLHSKGGVRAAGLFRVRHGSTRLARFAARVMGLPSEGMNVDLRLIVTPSSRGERWRRYFAGRPFATRQSASEGMLIEQAGFGEMRLELGVREGSLHYQSRNVALRLGQFRVGLPRWLAPSVTALERPDVDAVRVAVEVRLPFVGVLITYEGVLNRVEAKPC